MTIVFPDGVVYLVRADEIEPGALAYFPDGERYAVIRVAHTANGTKVRIEGKSWADWIDASTWRARRAQCTVPADEVIPVVRPPLDA